MALNFGHHSKVFSSTFLAGGPSNSVDRCTNCVKKCTRIAGGADDHVLSYRKCGTYLAAGLDCRLLYRLVKGTWFSLGPNLQDGVEEQRAAVLLGLPMEDLRRCSRVAGLGHLENGERGEQMAFTYEG